MLSQVLLWKLLEFYLSLIKNLVHTWWISFNQGVETNVQRLSSEFSLSPLQGEKRCDTLSVVSLPFPSPFHHPTPVKNRENVLQYWVNTELAKTFHSGRYNYQKTSQNQRVISIKKLFPSTMIRGTPINIAMSLNFKTLEEALLAFEKQNHIIELVYKPYQRSKLI